MEARVSAPPRHAGKDAAQPDAVESTVASRNAPQNGDEPAAERGAHSAAAAKALRRIDWHPTAPKAVRDAVAADDSLRAWKAWRRHLGQRRLRPLAKLLRGTPSPLAWALPATAVDRKTAMLVELASGNDRATRKRLTAGAGWDEIVAKWLAERRDAPADATGAVEALAWCHALPWLADEIAADVWCGLFEHLVSVAVDAPAISLTTDPLAHQLYAGELPLALAYLFPEIKNTRAMRKSARRALSRGPVDLLNGEGLPTWVDLAIARPLLACWTRCAAIGRQQQRDSKRGGGCWNAKAADQYRWFVLASLRLARRDGSQMLTDAVNDAAGRNANRELLAAALRFADCAEARRVASIVLPPIVDKKVAAKKAAAKRAKTRTGALPPASYHCEWSGVSALRPRWQRGGTRLALAFGAQHVQLELCCGRDVVLSGPWSAEVTIDGRRLEPVGTWEESCWLSKRRADYVELQLPLAEGVVLQRHIVLPRDDGFLLLADSVVGYNWRPPQEDDQAQHGRSPSQSANGNGDAASRHDGGAGTPAAADPTPHRIAYRGTLPLALGVAFVGETETREAVLRTARPRALAMPLALPEWRSDSRIGSFAATDGQLELRQSNPGTSLVAPLFFDLRRKRFAGDRTWRQLTVAEDRQIQPPDRAVGYRVHIGGEQWIVYRSLTPRGNRTLLSHNLSTEFLVARFEPHSDATSPVTPLVEIE